MQYDVTNHSNNSSEVELNNFVLNQSGVSEEGRLILPAVWKKSVIHRLPDNYSLAHNVLKSTYKKQEKQPDKLHQYDMTIKMQLDQGILSEVSTDALHNNPDISFLAYNAVFKDQNSSTKCRVVFLSNICDKNNKNNLSHNQVSMPGNQLINKLSNNFSVI